MSEMISVASGFQYSVNIGYDLNHDDKLQNFIPTKSSLQLLQDILESTDDSSTERARVLVGAYGKGKSHIVLTILSILMGKDWSVFTKLSDKVDNDPELDRLRKNYYESKKKLLPVVINGSNTSMQQAFLLALQKALSENDLMGVMPETNYKAAIKAIERWHEDFPDTYRKFKKGIGQPVDIFIEKLETFDLEAYEDFIKIYPDLTSGSMFNPFSGFDIAELYESVVKCIKPIANTEDNDEDFNDYAQSDYDELYSTVIELEPDLEPLVNDIKRVRPAQYKEIPRLIMQAQDGNFHARERLIEIHLRSALRIAFQRAILFDEDISECFGNACVGVVTAIDKYDSRKNGPIGSYVSMWVLQTMMREQSPKCNLYFPVHKREPYFLVYPALKAYGCTQCAKLLECKKARSIVKEELDFFYEESEITDVLVQSSTFMSLEEISEIGGDVDDLFYEYDYFIDNTDLLAVTNERKQIISKSLSQYFFRIV